MYVESVESELKQLVKVLASKVPILKEVRVFGSYQNGNWNPEESDIDVFVLTGDENYYVYKDRRDDGYWSLESRQREELKKQIRDGIKGEYKDRFSLHVVTPRDVRRLTGIDEGRGDIGRNMKNGRMIYPKK